MEEGIAPPGEDPSASRCCLPFRSCPCSGSKGRQTPTLRNLRVRHPSKTTCSGSLFGSIKLPCLYPRSLSLLPDKHPSSRSPVSLVSTLFCRNPFYLCDSPIGSILPPALSYPPIKLPPISSHPVIPPSPAPPLSSPRDLLQSPALTIGARFFEFQWFSGSDCFISVTQVCPPGLCSPRTSCPNSRARCWDDQF